MSHSHFGVIRIDRNISRSCLENTEDRDYRVNGVFEYQRDSVAGSYSERLKITRQLIGAMIKIAVAQRNAVEFNRRPLRGSQCLFFKEDVNAFIGRIFGRGVVPLNDKPVGFGLA